MPICIPTPQASLVGVPPTASTFVAPGLYCYDPSPTVRPCERLTFTTPIGVSTADITRHGSFVWSFKESEATAQATDYSWGQYFHAAYVNGSTSAVSYDSGTFHEPRYHYHGSYLDGYHRDDFNKVDIDVRHGSTMVSARIYCQTKQDHPVER